MVPVKMHYLSLLPEYPHLIIVSIPEFVKLNSNRVRSITA